MSEKDKQSAPVSITTADLKEILEAVRKPVKSDEEIRAEGQRKADRTALAAQVKAAHEAREQSQRDCTHMRRDGSTAAVFVTSLNALLCQTCQAVIRPSEQPDVFNRIFQLTQ